MEIFLLSPFRLAFINKSHCIIHHRPAEKGVTLPTELCVELAARLSDVCSMYLSPHQGTVYLKDTIQIWNIPIYALNQEWCLGVSPRESSRKHVGMLKVVEFVLPQRTKSPRLLFFFFNTVAQVPFLRYLKTGKFRTESSTPQLDGNSLRAGALHTCHHQLLGLQIADTLLIVWLGWGSRTQATCNRGV